MPETLVRVAVEIPPDLLAHYERQAKALDVSLETVLEVRLKECRDHGGGKRTLFFTDVQREELEQILGGSTFKDANAVIRALQTRYTVRIQGQQPIKLEEGLYTRLKELASEITAPVEDLVAEGVRNGLSDRAWGSH